MEREAIRWENGEIETAEEIAKRCLGSKLPREIVIINFPDDQQISGLYFAGKVIVTDHYLDLVLSRASFSEN